MIKVMELILETLRNIATELKKKNITVELENQIELFEIPDIQKKTGWGYNTCRDLFKRTDFPRNNNRK